jgi:dolichyl-diphosphooligosaccharide--protein glycosyltransferase
MRETNAQNANVQQEEEEVYSGPSFFDTFQELGRKAAPSINLATLGLISLLAFLIRIFSVIRYESVIHEFDPWFNYRVTQYLTSEGAYAFWNWYDPESWYPLGRIIGGTTYPGLMFTSALLHWLCNTLLFPVDIRNVCVFLAPVFAALTAVSSYYFVKEVTGRSDSGLLSALFIAIVPGYISRSVAGSYDNEGVAIFALVTTFYFFIKAVNTGSIMWATLCALLYFYMVAAWGGYVFIINLIPLYTLFLIIVGRTDVKIYIAYSVFYILGTILSMQVPFVMFQAIKSSEHMLSHGVFIILQVYMFVQFIKTNLSEEQYQRLFKISLMGTSALFVMAFLYLIYKGSITFSARSLTLLDPTYAKKFIPIVASVSEHQPTTWSSFFFDLHYLLIFAPLGLYFCYLKPTNSRLFVAIFGVSSVYFSCVMVRLLLLSSPALCLLSGIGVSELIHFFMKQIKNYSPRNDEEDEANPQRRNVQPKQNKYRYSIEIVLIFIFILITMLISYVFHCTWVGAEAYSSPSIILANKDRYGNKHIVDDFREAYYWLRMNTKPDAKIVSWWDYGYQIAGMSNRAVIVDNNTWNATHIALVGSTLTNDEEESFRICKMIDADYVLIIFGGYSAYSGDDINKFIWIIRITAGYYPRVKEENFLARGVYRTDSGASETMLNSMMYKFSYYRFDEIKTSKSSPEGYDQVRGYVMGRKNIKLRHFTEAYTTDNWIVRIYAVNDYPNREIAIKSRFKLKLLYIPSKEFLKLNPPRRELA